MTSKWVKKNHVVYVYGPFDRVWAEEHPLRFSWIKEYMFIYLQTDYEMHWILRIFYRIFWISIFNTCSYGELFTGVSPVGVPNPHHEHFWQAKKKEKKEKKGKQAKNYILSTKIHPTPKTWGGGTFDIVSPTWKNVGGTRPPRPPPPPGFAPMLCRVRWRHCHEIFGPFHLHIYVVML